LHGPPGLTNDIQIDIAPGVFLGVVTSVTLLANRVHGGRIKWCPIRIVHLSNHIILPQATRRRIAGPHEPPVIGNSECTRLLVTVSTKCLDRCPLRSRRGGCGWRWSGCRGRGCGWTSCSGCACMGGGAALIVGGSRSSGAAGCVADRRSDASTENANQQERANSNGDPLPGLQPSPKRSQRSWRLWWGRWVAYIPCRRISATAHWRIARLTIEWRLRSPNRSWSTDGAGGIVSRHRRRIIILRRYGRRCR